MTPRNVLAAGVMVLVGCLPLLGCSTHEYPLLPPLEIGVALVPQDFRSSFGSGGRDTIGPRDEWHGALGVVWSGWLREDRELTRTAVEVIGRGLYLVELSSGARVPGEVREGVVRVDGEVVPGSFPDGDVLGLVSFVPSEPLADGWYVLVADLREWMAMGPPVPTMLDTSAVEDDMMFVRIRIGSEPTWFRSSVTCGTRELGHSRPTWCEVSVAYTEEASSPGTTRFELRAGGELVSDCVEPVAGVWDCPHYPEGTEFEIRLVESDVVHALDGVTAQTLVGGGQSHREALISPRFGIDIARSAR